MKHSDLKVGMKVKRVSNFNDEFYTSTDGSISTVSAVNSSFFNTEEDVIRLWDAKYFEPVIEEQTKEEVTMNKIDMNKKYRTRCGYPVRVLCTDMKSGKYTVVALVYTMLGETPICFTEFGFEVYNQEGDYDLIEVSPWEDFKKDDKVMVRDGAWYTWAPRYFSHVEDGKPYTFINGRTSFSSEGKETKCWEYCRKPTKEELGE